LLIISPTFTPVGNVLPHVTVKQNVFTLFLKVVSDTSEDHRSHGKPLQATRPWRQKLQSP